MVEVLSINIDQVSVDTAALHISWYNKLYASQVDKLNTPVQFKYRQLEFRSIQDGYQATDPSTDQWD